MARGQNPASKAALSKKLPPNPPGVVSRSHNIKAAAETHRRFAALSAEQRGQLLERALETEFFELGDRIPGGREDMRKIYRIYKLNAPVLCEDTEGYKHQVLKLQILKQWWLDDSGEYGGGSLIDYVTFKEAEAKLLEENRYGEYIILPVYLT